jgi:hypothetical protein
MILGFRVQGLGFRVHGLGVRIYLISSDDTIGETWVLKEIVIARS